MALKLTGFEGNGTFARGVHPPGRKQYSEAAVIEAVPSPKRVVLPLLQNLGAPCGAVVKPKQAREIPEFEEGKVSGKRRVHGQAGRSHRRRAR